MRGSAHDLDQRPRERAVLVGGKCDRATAVAVHVHQLNRRNSIRCEPLPRAEAAQKLGAAGTDGVDALIPIFGAGRTLEGRERASFQQCDSEPMTGKGERERHADQSRAQDDDVVIRPGSIHSTSMK